MKQSVLMCSCFMFAAEESLSPVPAFELCAIDKSSTLLELLQNRGLCRNGLRRDALEA